MSTSTSPTTTGGGRHHHRRGDNSAAAEEKTGSTPSGRMRRGPNSTTPTMEKQGSIFRMELETASGKAFSKDFAKSKLQVHQGEGGHWKKSSFTDLSDFEGGAESLPSRKLANALSKLRVANAFKNKLQQKQQRGGGGGTTTGVGMSTVPEETKTLEDDPRQQPNERTASVMSLRNSVVSVTLNMEENSDDDDEAKHADDNSEDLVSDEDNGTSTKKKPVVHSSHPSGSKKTDLKMLSKQVEEEAQSKEGALLMKNDPGIPDEWVSRHDDLIRLSGRHPFNAEPPIRKLMGSVDGKVVNFFTPNSLHFIRNHGGVPKLSWEEHTLSITIPASLTKDKTSHQFLTFTMSELEEMSYQELPVTVICTGNRRSENNAIRRTIGFSWGPGAVATTLYQGVPLHQLLTEAGITLNAENYQGCHAEFVGSDSLPNKVGTGPFPDTPWGDTLNYATSIPLGKAMDPARDVMLVYKMNGEPIPPDHGYPLRILVPGSTGGRCVKWLKEINILEHESHQLYHYHDNKIFPPHVLSLEQSQEEDWWYRPEYIVHEININSVISRPGHDDVLHVEVPASTSSTPEEQKKTTSSDDSSPPKKANKGTSSPAVATPLFELAGYAYAGGGRKINRVELSLDQGTNWDLADLTRHETPTAHDMHWCWIFWSMKRPSTDLVDSDEIWVRAWDETNNTQPVNLTWNLMGLGNNCMYKVKVRHEVTAAHLDGSKVMTLYFEHPTQPGATPGGWMTRKNDMPRSAGFGLLQQEENDDDEDEFQTGGKIITQEELHSHNTEDSPWIAVNGKVYDCTKYIESAMHPGGKDSILICAGKVCTVEFDAVHSVGATKMLMEYYIGDLETDETLEEQGNFDDDVQKILDRLEEEDDAEALDPKLVLESTTRCLERIDEEYGFRKDNAEMDPSHAVVITEWWQKTRQTNLDAFSEALVGRWRLLVAIEEVMSAGESLDGSDEDWLVDRARCAEINRESFLLLTKNKDPIAVGLGVKLLILKNILQILIDNAVINPNHAADGEGLFYYNLEDLKAYGILDGSLEEIGKVFVRSSIKAKHWLSFIKAFLWAVSTHSPFLRKVDDNELEDKSAFEAFASHMIARSMIECVDVLKAEFRTAPYLLLQSFGNHITSLDTATVQELVAVPFFNLLFANSPGLMDYFSKTDMDAQSAHATYAILSVFRTCEGILKQDTEWRSMVDRVTKTHLNHRIPTKAFQVWGATLLQILTPHFESWARKSSAGRFACTAEEIENAFACIVFEVINEVTRGVCCLELLEQESVNFYDMLLRECNWPQDYITTRLIETKIEMSRGSFKYRQTTEELEAGVRNAWRNSSDIWFRSMWDKLQVLDRRNVNTYKGIAKTIDEHLRAVASDKHTEPVVVIFGAKEIDEAWGIRCWNQDYFSYAGYSGADGKLTGDLSNTAYTDFLRSFRLWLPPTEKTHFDLLPVLFKLPGARPFAYTIPADLRLEVPIEHPNYEGFCSLGLKWPVVKFRSNMKAFIGGLEYQCCAFNTPYKAGEIVQGLYNRPGLVSSIAEVIGASPGQHLFTKRVQFELELAVIHSYKKHGHPIFDDETCDAASRNFLRDEMRFGRNDLVVQGVKLHKKCRFVPSCDSLLVTMASDDVIVQKDKEDNQDLFESQQLVPKVLILYGSQTGNSELTARRVKNELKLLRPTMLDLNSATGLSIIKEKGITHVLAVCSTFNRAEFPHNAKKFEATGLDDGVLSGVKFAVLGLGSTVYSDFCAAAIKLDQMLQSAGGKNLQPLTKVDCSGDMEGPIADWLRLVSKTILPADVKAALGGDSSVPAVYDIKWLKKSTAPSRHRGHLFSWPSTEESLMLCIHNEELTGKNGDPSRSIRRITFALPPGVTYESGDHLCVHPINSAEAVKRFAMCFKSELLGDDDNTNQAKLSHQLHVPFTIESIEDGGVATEAQCWFRTPTTLVELLGTQIEFLINEAQVDEFLKLVWGSIVGSDGKISPDLAKAHPDLVAELEGYCKQAQLGPAESKKAFSESFLSQFPTFMDFFEYFHFVPSQLGLAKVLQSMARLQPRYYSISSSSRANSTTVSITVGVVRFVTGTGVSVRGTCSNYLASMKAGESLGKVVVRTSTFRGPTSPTTPTIMVGPGTGLAPMLGFLADRAIDLAQISFSAESNNNNDKPQNNCHLFFGCRTDGDRIYGEEIAQWESDEVLHLHLALSRSKEFPKKYVTDLMKEMGETVHKLLLDPTLCIYICGDAKVANDVSEICLELLRTYGSMTRVRAAQHLRLMKMQKRWQTDLWGTPKGLDNVGAIQVNKAKQSKTNTSNAWFKSVT